MFGLTKDERGNIMGYKIFVSYKYKDEDVEKIDNVMPPTWPCDYVDLIKDEILSNDDIYKGENSDEDISAWSDDKIWNHLKDKIYDSSITIVLISPNMKECRKWETSQWIPWEISFSLRETIRKNRKSHNNAMLAVVLPDKNGSYCYYDNLTLFPILKSNIVNGYIYVTKWDNFTKQPEESIETALKQRNETPKSKIKKSL